MKQPTNLYELSVAEVLTLSCALVRAIDRHDSLASLFDARPHPITDARTGAMHVAFLSAIEFLEGNGAEGPDDDLLVQTEALLTTLGVRRD